MLQGKGGRGLILSWLLFLSLHMAYEIAFVITWYMYWGMADVKLLFATVRFPTSLYSLLYCAVLVCCSSYETKAWLAHKSHKSIQPNDNVLFLVYLQPIILMFIYSALKTAMNVSTRIALVFRN